MAESRRAEFSLHRAPRGYVDDLPQDCDASEFWIAEAMDAGFTFEQALFLLTHVNFSFPSGKEWERAKNKGKAVSVTDGVKP